MIRSWGTQSPVRSQTGAPSRVFLGLLLILTIASVACGDDAAPAEVSAHATPDAGPGPRAHDAGKTTSQSDAAAPAAAARFASATAMLTSLLDDAADGGIALHGDARWSSTSEGVDFEMTLQGCVGEELLSIAIQQASDCSPESLRGPVWADRRGAGLPALHCVGTGAGLAGTAYERSSMRPNAWSVGDQAASDVVGHALVVRDVRSDQAIACGVITRAADRERPALPSADQPPKLESRAAVGSACFLQQFSGASSACPDKEALLSCEAVHCDLTACLDSCAAYTSCLDQQSDVCSFTNGCQPSAECAQCQGAMQQCALQFCGEHALCGALPTPDGPCQRLSGCCVQQGANTDTCLGILVPLLSSLGGDSNCLASMQDWDVVSHLHVPCTFGPGEPSSVADIQQPDNAAPQLADGRAGAACTSDADCAGGNCAQSAAGGGGFCTRACQTTSQCGLGGICTGGQSTSGKQCLATCEEPADCRAGFVCTGRLQSRISVPGACSPQRRPDQLADNTAGRACQKDNECSGGQCAKTNLVGTSYPGNYCTARCYEDTQCGQGGLCLWTHHSSDPGYCLQGCVSDADCTREEYGCWDLGDGTRVRRGCYPRSRPLPDGRAGQACASDADCGAPHATCAKEIPYVGLVTNDLRPAPGGYCTQRCSLDIECGAGAQCINSGSSGGMCLASCSKAAPCREGYECFAHARDNDQTASVCLTPGL